MVQDFFRVTVDVNNLDIILFDCTITGKQILHDRFV